MAANPAAAASPAQAVWRAPLPAEVEDWPSVSEDCVESEDELVVAVDEESVGLEPSLLL